MINTICTWSYAAGDLMARVGIALAMMALAMFLTPIALDALHGVRRWRAARRGR